MSYQEYKPSPHLQPYVDTFWVSKNEDCTTECKILPDGFIDIVFDINEGTEFLSNDDIRISGMMTAYRNIKSRSQSKTLGVRFKAGQLGSLSKFPFSEIKNSTIRASDLLPNFNISLMEKLIEKDNLPSRIALVETALIRQIAKVNARKDRLIPSVCEVIQAKYQTINLASVASEHHISARQLERRFKASVGVSMKEYQSIIRFKKALESISKNHGTSLLLTAFDHGYFDHAHLTKSFNKMAGVNPSEL